jgi:molybdopterin converting factor small subunit
VQIAIVIPQVLREYAAGVAEFHAEAADVGAALGALTDSYPLLQRHLFGDTGELRPYVNVFLNLDELRALPAGVATPLTRGDVITILPSVAGG